MFLHTRKYLYKVFYLLGLVALFFGGFYAGQHYNSPTAELDKLPYIANKEPTLPITADFAPFWKTWNLINEKFVDGHASSTGTTTAAYNAAYKPVSDQNKIYGA